MKRRFGVTTIMMSVTLFAMGSVGCGQDRRAADTNTQASTVTDSAKTTKMKIKIGDKVFAATLYDNKTAEAFKKLLPLTIEMGEFNGNEKDHKFSTSFPTDASNPGTIKAGELMIWGESTL